MSIFNIKYLLPTFILSLCLVNCSNNRNKAEAKEETPRIVAFCQSIDYADTAAIHSDTTMARLMTDIVKLMMKSDSTATSKALGVFFSGLNGDETAIRSAAHYADRYLNNPNSPVRNETLYIRFLTSLLSREELPEDVADRAENHLHRASLNRPGSIANDLRYIDRYGHEGTLHEISAPQTMLIFYDPECPHCPGILQKIAKDKEVNARIASGKLKVLAVYTEGKRDVWEKDKNHMPKQWTVAYDLSDIVDNEIYDIPAMPTVYLLDAGKRVLVKDMSW